MGERLVTLAGFENEGQAQFLVERLDNAGIKAVVEGAEQDLASPEPREITSLNGPVLVKVPEELLKKASAVFEEETDSDMGPINPHIL